MLWTTWLGIFRMLCKVSEFARRARLQEPEPEPVPEYDNLDYLATLCGRRVRTVSPISAPPTVTPDS